MSVLQKVFVPTSGNPDDVRMTLGEHLEELRTRLIRAIVGVFVGAAFCYYFIDYIQALLMWPVFAIYRMHGLPAEVKSLAPAEQFMTDLKVTIILGIILSAPYSLAQIWGFIAAGLYPHERKWVRGFAPVSIILFFTGALFLIVVVNPLLLNFLINYRTDLPDVEWMMPTRLIGSPDSDIMQIPQTSQPTDWTGQPLPNFVREAPPEVPDGLPWLNRSAHEIHVRYGGKVFAIGHLRLVSERNRVVPDIRISEIIPFTLQLAAAFGIGFQVPVVVAFLAAINIFTAAEMAKYRRHVMFVMAIAAAIVTPSPDPFSMMMLLVPMVGLFEAGLFVARRIERRRAAAA